VNPKERRGTKGRVVFTYYACLLFGCKQCFVNGVDISCVQCDNGRLYNAFDGAHSIAIIIIIIKK
jgi:hypothetical protein